MKKYIIYYIIISGINLNVKSQERLFFIGWTKNYISKDSTNFAFNIDLNRIPGSTEKVGGTFFLNTTKNTSKWGWYIKPSIDVNIGTGTTTAANNINVGIPVGLAYDGIPFSEFFIEGSPELVADKTFDNYLIYYSIGPYFKYEYLKNVLFNVLTGVAVANGKRTYSSKSKENNSYGRVTVPIYLKLSFLKTTSGTGATAKDYRRIHITHSFKFNYVYNDNSTTTPDPSLFYNTTKAEYYFIPRLAFAASYTSGYEEPLFKKIKTVSIGLTFARF
jgi:hypothetical protein